MGEVILTSREGGWKDPGVSLRRSEERRRLTLLREDSERSHSLPREAELCHYERKHSQPTPCCSLSRKLAQPPFKAHFWALRVCSPSPGLQVLTTCAGDLRELNMVPLRSQGHCGVGRGLSELHWVWCNGRGPHLEWTQEPQASSPFLTRIPWSLQSRDKRVTSQGKAKAYGQVYAL